MNKRKTIINCILIILVIIGLSIGYSSFSNNLSIELLSAHVRVNKDVRVAGLTIESISSDASITYTDYNKDNVQIGAILPNKDSYIVINAKIINIGNVEVAIKDILGLDDRFEYQLLNYNLGDMICDNNNTSCKNGIEQNIKIKIKYKNTTTNINNNSTNLLLKFNFKEIYNINYSNEILKYLIGDNIKRNTLANTDLEIDINVEYIENIIVKSKGKNLIKNIDYTYSDNKLIIKNVEGDIELDYYPIETVDNEEKYGLKFDVAWENPNTALFNINGKLLNDVYVGLSPGNIQIEKDRIKLYNALNPVLYQSGKTVFIKYEYVSGNIAPTTGTVTIKYRDMSSQSIALSTAELIANHSKANFKLDETVEKTGKLTTDVSLLSFFTTQGTVFDNLQFKITYGVKE